jgi:hypothetical protein
MIRDKIIDYPGVRSHISGHAKQAGGGLDLRSTRAHPEVAPFTGGLP